MRIIAGRNKGRKLAEPGRGDPAAHLRPTSDRVRESLFGVLTGGRVPLELQDTRVLDIFAGSGALGLEALSRGAAHVTFVETGRAALALLGRNITLCGAGAETEILRQDATRLSPNPGAPFDLIFMDPPYGKEMGEKALRAALSGGWVAEEAIVVWEEDGPPRVPAAFQMLDRRRFGGTTITVLRFVGASHPG